MDLDASSNRDTSFDAPLDIPPQVILSPELSVDPGYSVNQLKVGWSYQGAVEQFPPKPIAKEPDRFLGRVSSFRLPSQRDQHIRAFHNLLQSRYDNGGVLSGFYFLHSFAETNGMDTHWVIPQLFHCINAYSSFPTPLSGCSAYPVEQGKFSKLSLRELMGDFFKILKYGGAYAKELEDQQAIEPTTLYMRALLGPNPATSLDCYQLDPCFSLWFCDVAWDYAYVLIHRNESWASLIAITDCD